MDLSRIMTRRVVTVGLDDSVLTARALFEQHRFHHLLVVNRGKVVGVLSDRDLLRTISPFVGKLAERSQDLHTLKRRVHQVMTRDLVTADEDMSVADAARVMIGFNVSCLPVVDGEGRPVGIVTWKDLVRAFVPDAKPLEQSAAKTQRESAT